MLDRPSTPKATLVRARRIALANGLRHVYTGNVHDPEGQTTWCHGCGARLVAVWLTHAHLDHIGGIAGIRRAWPGVPVHLHPLDLPVYAWGEKSARVYGIPFEQPAPPDRALAEGQVLEFAGERFEVWHLPGHAPGHVAFVL